MMAGGGDGKFVLKAQVEGLDVFSIINVSSLGVILFIVTLFYLEGLFHRTEQAEFMRKNVDAPPIELSELEGAQAERLSGYAWTDREHGFASIPIAEAEVLLLKRLNSGQTAFDGAAAPAPAATPGAETTTDETASPEVLNDGSAGAASEEDAEQADAGTATGH